MKFSILQSNKEFHPIWFYVPAVLLYWLFDNRQTPVLEIVWDSVFYKDLAYAFFHFSTFDIRQHFPMPPLYPILLSPAFLISTFQGVELMQSFINAALYFSGLFPFYYYARLFLSTRDSAGVCLLYILYPGSIFSQWTMSENLAVPLVITVFYLAVRLSIAENPSRKEAIALGISLAAVLLTRIFLLVFCISILGWLFLTFFRARKPLQPLWTALGTACLSVLFLWWSLGYLSIQGQSLLYADFNTTPMLSLINRSAMIFVSHWTGLWLEGGLILPLFLIGQRARFHFQNSQNYPGLRESTLLLFWVAIGFTAAVAAFYTKRIGIEPWSISLRYIFYINILCLPIAVSAFGKFRTMSRKDRLTFFLGIGVTVVFCSIAFYIPEAWDKLRTNHDYAANAPSLSFLYQMRGKGYLLVSISLMTAGIILCLLSTLSRRAGYFLLAILLIYIQARAFDYLTDNRKYQAEQFHNKDIAAFCASLEAGNWKNISIYHGNEFIYLDPNLHYWVNRASSLLPEKYEKIPRPFLFVSLYYLPGSKIVFESGQVKAMLVE